MNYKNWTPEESKLLGELVTGGKHSYNQMVPFFIGRSGTSLRKHAISALGMNQKGHIHKLHSYNQTFFAVPNPINSYVAGFWAADGHVTDNPTTRLIAIELSHTERHQLETFKKLMEYTGDVKDSSYPGREAMCALRLYSAYQLASDLEKNFGIGPRKTHRLPAPNLIDSHLQLCYLAGLLDGDGCVCISNQDRLSIQYASSSLEIINWVKSFTDSLNLTTIRIKRGGEIHDLRPAANAYRYQIAGMKAVDLIKRVQGLKAEGVPILNRKWDNPTLNAYIADYEARFKEIPDAA